MEHSKYSLIKVPYCHDSYIFSQMITNILVYEWKLMQFNILLLSWYDVKL